MKLVIDRLFVTPISWLLAVPIVLLDRLLASDLTELPDRDTRLVHCQDEMLTDAN